MQGVEEESSLRKKRRVRGGKLSSIRECPLVGIAFHQGVEKKKEVKGRN